MYNKNNGYEIDKNDIMILKIMLEILPVIRDISAFYIK